MDMENIQELLSEAEKQLELQRKHQQETGEAFNIFTVLDRERKEESTHCRLLYELLDPDGRHGCGDAFLKKIAASNSKLIIPDSDQIICQGCYVEVNIPSKVTTIDTVAFEHCSSLSELILLNGLL